MKRIILLSVMLFCLMQSGFSHTNRSNKQEEKIQVAILLDTSGSMQGLIEQAKSRLWNIVNTLTTLKYKGKEPQIEIALYEYGSYKRYGGDYIRQIVPLTTDLDRISAELFALTTGGSEEYCGTVIQRAVTELEWGNKPSDMKLIYIAGNEIFEQGNVPYKKAMQKAVAANIHVNTIHCGSLQEGIRDLWQDAADHGKGKFFNIDHNARLRHHNTPYDAKIIECNDRLNKTYIGYGRKGEEGMLNQVAQDQNAMLVSASIQAERSISKSKAIYQNQSWDLVDLVKEDEKALDKIKKEDLPAELKNKSQAEVKAYVKQKEEERARIQEEIAQLDKQRREYIQQVVEKEDGGDDLGKAITESILAFANEKGYSY